MSLFSDNFKAGGAPLLLEYYGQPMVYHPRNGTARTITMVVDEDPPEPAAGRGLKPKIRFECLNDATDGIDQDSFNAGGDYVVDPEGKVNKGEKIYLHSKPQENGDGMLVLEV